MEEHVRSEVSANRQSDAEKARVPHEHNPADGDGSASGPTRRNMQWAARGGDPIDDEFPADASADRINDAASDPDSDPRRSGGSPNDPDGGHELLGHEWRGPDPDPVHELVPGGQGAEPPPYSGEELAAAMTNVALRQPGSVPNEIDPPTLGNPEIGADPSSLAPAMDPASAAARQREGMHESGGQGPAGNNGSTSHQASDADQARETSAYTRSQKPNLPPRASPEPEIPDHVQGSGRLGEPVEGRQNSLVFDSRSGNFEVKEERHETAVSSQKGAAPS